MATTGQSRHHTTSVRTGCMTSRRHSSSAHTRRPDASGRTNSPWRGRASSRRPVMSTRATRARRWPCPRPRPCHRSVEIDNSASTRSGHARAATPAREGPLGRVKVMSTEPRSRARAMSRRASPADTRWQGARTTMSNAPMTAATVADHCAGNGCITATRSSATPSSAAVARFTSATPTMATHDPVDEALAASANASVVDPGPRTATVMPRRNRPSGNSVANGSTSGNVWSRARVTGRARSATTCNRSRSTP